jgi:drug/metabolite transporter (DMT)-like permease
LKYRAFIQALVSAALFGLATPFSKTLLRDLPSNQLAGLLYLGAALCLCPLVVHRWVSGQPVLPSDGRNWRNLLGAILCGGIIGPVLLLIGLKHSLAASVSMWLNLETVATAVLAALLFREHLGKWAWIGNAGIFAAGLLLGFNQGWAGWFGLMCVSGAAVAWGLDNNFTAVIDGIRPIESTFWKGIIAGPVNLLLGSLLFPTTPGIDWLWSLGLGALCYGTSIVLYISAAQTLGASRSQMIFASAPFWGVAASMVWLGESLSLLQIAAAVLLVVSLAMLLLERHEHAHEHDSLTHEHQHEHDDLHHGHEHAEPVKGNHAHLHVHRPVVHAHPHWPDLHHRHHDR